MKFSSITAGALAVAASFGAVSAPAQARDPYIGEIMAIGGNYCPRGWAQAAGQYLPISGNEALFSVIGTTSGGDGRRPFALPDLRGRVAIAPVQTPMPEFGAQENRPPYLSIYHCIALQGVYPPRN